MHTVPSRPLACRWECCPAPPRPPPSERSRRCSSTIVVVDGVAVVEGEKEVDQINEMRGGEIKDTCIRQQIYVPTINKKDSTTVQ